MSEWWQSNSSNRRMLTSLEEQMFVSDNSGGLLCGRNSGEVSKSEALKRLGTLTKQNQTKESLATILIKSKNGQRALLTNTPPSPTRRQVTLARMIGRGSFRKVQLVIKSNSWSRGIYSLYWRLRGRYSPRIKVKKGCRMKFGWDWGKYERLQSPK